VSTPNAEWVERVQSIINTPLDLTEQRSGLRNWRLGDALLGIPAEHRDAVAEAAGLEKGNARTYWRTAEAWPPDSRGTPAAWTVYRDLAKEEDRFALIKPGMTVRGLYEARTGRQIDRRATHKMSDDDLIDEVVKLMLSPRRTSLVPKILSRLNTSKEGRKAARDRRSTHALRRLDDEIRQVQKEIRRLQSNKSPRARFAEVRKRLLETEVNVEEIGLLANDPDDRLYADDEDWRDLAARVVELADAANRVAAAILDRTEAVEADAWLADEDLWAIKELSSVDGNIADAEIVGDD
jgi:hypothetical protein